MKPSAILINTARGPIVDQSALIEALDQNRLAGAGIDVFDMELPLPANHPIFQARNIVLLPHVGFETVEAISAKADITLQHLEDFLRGRGVRRDKPAWSSEWKSGAADKAASLAGWKSPCRQLPVSDD